MFAVKLLESSASCRRQGARSTTDPGHCPRAAYVIPLSISVSRHIRPNTNDKHDDALECDCMDRDAVSAVVIEFHLPTSHKSVHDIDRYGDQ